LWEKVDQCGRRLTRRSGFKANLEQMFLGRYQHSIDDKGRLTIPVRYREFLADQGAFITQGFDHNLIVYPPEVFDRISQRVSRISMTDPNARNLRRLIFSSAEHVSVDKIGRILIPQFLREAGKFDGEVIIVGMGDHFELWSPELWTGQSALLQDNEPTALSFIDLDLSTGE
jgi:MraZ protein